ncbi:MAG: hypothetical protein QXN87_08945 [Candidatus Bathyarchaeia archaeon]
MSVLKDLGDLQRKIIFYLAENPKQHKESIMKSLEHKYYGSVLNAVKRLEKTKYLVSVRAKSKKNLKIKLYSCSEKGVFYALVKNEKTDVLKILENYKDYGVVKRLREICEMLGEEVFVKLIKLIQPFLPLVETMGAEEALGRAISYFLEHPDKLGDLREAIEKSPKAMEWMRSLR